MTLLWRYWRLFLWVRGRPSIVRSTAWQYPPWGLFALTTTGQVCTPVSYYEDGTVKVSIIDTRRYEISHDVFGIHPGDLKRLGDL